MSIADRLYRRPCTVRYWSAGPPDEHNNQTDQWTDVDTVCVFQGRARLQSGGDAEIGTTMWLVFFRARDLPSVPGSSDHLVVDGVDYNFHGDGWLALNPRGQPDHIETTAWRAA
jgi:hypothetical protein